MSACLFFFKLPDTRKIQLSLCGLLNSLQTFLAATHPVTGYPISSMGCSGFMIHGLQAAGNGCSPAFQGYMSCVVSLYCPARSFMFNAICCASLAMASWARIYPPAPLVAVTTGIWMLTLGIIAENSS